MGGWRVLLAIAAGLGLLGPGISACSRSGDAPQAAARPPSASPGREVELEQLRMALEAERERSLQLAAEVSELRRRLEELVPSDSPEPTDEVEAEPSSEAEDADQEDATRPGGEPWFQGEALLAKGVPSHEVERLRHIFDASEMDLIELNHRAKREGWFGSQRYRNALKVMRFDLRQRIGDESFDLLLFATGRKNRVVISDVLGNSPGERAGLQPGDVVISYAERRIFNPIGLQRATTRGRLGDYVPMDVLRGDEVVRLYPQRGPLGVKLKPARRMPEARW